MIGKGTEMQRRSETLRRAYNRGPLLHSTPPLAALVWGAWSAAGLHVIDRASITEVCLGSIAAHTQVGQRHRVCMNARCSAPLENVGVCVRGRVQ